MTATPIDIAFTDTVKNLQRRKGSRDSYAQMAERGAWEGRLTPEVAAFIEDQNSAYLGTVSADGQPYIQHRGGPRGFLNVRDGETIAFADFRGNRQYISQGNLQDNPRAFLFLMDYRLPRRLKLWGEAKVIEGDAALEDALMPIGYRAKPEQVIEFKVRLWDFNCRQHLPRLVDADEADLALAQRDRRIEALEATIERLRDEVGAAP